MIWIATLCLLAVIAWLFFNGLNERRWVESHSHDETVAADKGILPDMSGLADKVSDASGGRITTENASAQLNKAVEKVKVSSESAGRKIGQALSDARTHNSDSPIGRTSARVSRAQQELGERWREHSGKIADKVSGKLDRADSAVSKAGSRVEDAATGGQPTSKK